MQNLYVVNPNASAGELKEAIHRMLKQAKAILTSVMFAEEHIRRDKELDNSTIYYALWAADCKLEELERLLNQLERTEPNQQLSPG
jgi:hypothetical protein